MKRAFDILVAFCALAILWPVLLVVAILVRVFLGSPVLFRQERPGLNGEVFTLLKFRTMVDAYGADGRQLPDRERLTRFGRFLRSTSLDELPELWNVLVGEMSLVGPRPLLVRYLERYSSRQSRRHEVRPGLTGWAQVNGRNTQSWEDRLEMDVWYVDNQTFWLDLKVLFRTVVLVFKREGVSDHGEATKAEFRPPEGG